jgi:phage replication O-like protein O
VPLPKDFSGFPEPQYTRTPNLIFDSLLAELSGSQLKTLLFVVRKTMGWRHDHDMVPISIAQIALGTGLCNRAVIDAIKWLCDCKMVLREKQRGFEGRQGVSTYRLRFEGDDPTEEIPECKKVTLESAQTLDSRVNSMEQKVHSGGGAYNNVFKENKEKSNSPTSEQSSQDLQHNTQDELVDFWEPEEKSKPNSAPAPEDTEARSFKYVRKGRNKPERPHAKADRSRELRESRFLGHNEPPSALETTQRMCGSTQAPASAPSVLERNYVSDWNRLVPSRPALLWDDQIDGPLLRKAASNPSFSENIEVIFAKAELINCAAIDSSERPWLTFQTLLSNSKNGQPHWHRVNTGQYDGMLKPKSNVGKSGAPDWVHKALESKRQRELRDLKAKESPNV